MAGTAVDEKWTMDKLDSCNWTTWKFQMRHLLLAKGLWGYVDGTEQLPENANAQTRAEFQKKSQGAFSVIVMAISTPQLYLVTSYEQPKDSWDALRNHFERETLANKLFLKKKYFRAEMKEGTSIEAHLKDMKEITDKLAAIGSAISEEDQVVTLLGSLPRSYATLVTALEARVDDVRLTHVREALIHEEQKLQTQFQSLSTSSYETKTTSALLGGQRKAKVHKVKCFECGQAGHFRRDCPKRKDTDGIKALHKAKTAEENLSDSDTDDFEVFTASVSTVKAQQMGKWLVDSGASSHMTREKAFLCEY